MQITGSQFTNTAALFGNDLATFPDFPAEIRAPAGTLPGVSGFQVNFSSLDVYTPGDQVDVLVAMNPAALATNVADLKTNGILIVNTDNFKESTSRRRRPRRTRSRTTPSTATASSRSTSPASRGWP